MDDLTSAPEADRPAYPPAGLAGAAPLDSPRTSWPPWTAPVALIAGLVVAVVGALLVDVPALALGVNVSAQHLPEGLQIADTAVQDLGFVLVAVFFAQLGGRTVAAWQFGLRPTRFWRAVGWIALVGVGFVLFSLAWKVIVHPPEEKVLEQIGTGVLSAALTCVVAPIGEEVLFRGYIFTALRNWRGAWSAAVITGLLFGLVHVGSAPLLDLVPLAVLGSALCVLYRRTGSLYPCIALHSLNNSIAFGSLAKWNWEWQTPLLIVGSLAAIALLAVLLARVGVISPERPLATRA
ncbi:MAG: protease family protein [Solirubrobacteraceae bacterium]|nr:protease family protein [Solirubrobacteraceae bacterium]